MIKVALVTSFFLLFQFETTVKSCTPAKLKRLHKGKKENLDGFELILEDSVLFPEGGGQVNICLEVTN